MFAIRNSTTLRSMQLVQIGETKQKTVLEMIMEISERQWLEIAELKARALSAATSTRSPRPARRCHQNKLRP